jgi:hypothetical protein
MCGVSNGVNSFSLTADAVPATAPRTFAKCSATTGTTVVMDVNDCYEFSMAKGAGFDFTEIRSKDHPSGCFLQGGDRTKFSQNGKESAMVQVSFNSVPEQFAAPETQFEMVCKAGTVCASTDGNATNVVSCVCGEKECESGSTCTSSESKCTLVNQAEKVVALEAEVVALRIKVVELEAKDTALEAKDTALEAKDTALEAKDTALEAKDTALEAKDTALETKAVALAKQYDGIDKMCKGDDKGGDERRLDSAAVGCGGASDAEFTYLSGSSHTEQALLVGAMVIAATIINNI